MYLKKEQASNTHTYIIIAKLLQLKIISKSNISGYAYIISIFLIWIN